jgi:hypothetical protein
MNKENNIDYELFIKNVQSNEVTEKFFLFVNKEFIRKIVEKIEENFYPISLSMDINGRLTINNRIAKESDFTWEQLEWYAETSAKYIGVCLCPMALVGHINSLLKDIDKG